jgi:hypothetical protein
LSTSVTVESPLPVKSIPSGPRWPIEFVPSWAGATEKYLDSTGSIRSWNSSASDCA